MRRSTDAGTTSRPIPRYIPATEKSLHCLPTQELQSPTASAAFSIGCSALARPGPGGTVKSGPDLEPPARQRYRGRINERPFQALPTGRRQSVGPAGALAIPQPAPTPGPTRCVTPSRDNGPGIRGPVKVELRGVTCSVQVHRFDIAVCPPDSEPRGPGRGAADSHVGSTVSDGSCPSSMAGRLLSVRAGEESLRFSGGRGDADVVNRISHLGTLTCLPRFIAQCLVSRAGATNFSATTSPETLASAADPDAAQRSQYAESLQQP
jgi:hypothetical protein